MSSHLAREIWKRFGSWYGVDALERKFGDAKPPSDWCEAVDAIGKERIDIVMSLVRSKYPQFLPSLPEFEQLDRQSRPRPATGPLRPSTQYLLNCYVMKHFPLEPMQLAAPWTYLYRGNPYPGSTDFEITGAIVPAHGKACAIRVMCSEINLDQVWQDEQDRVYELERKRNQQWVNAQNILPSIA